MLKKTPHYLCAATALSLALLGAYANAGTAKTAPGAPAAAQAAVFARVGDTVITQDEFNAAFNSASRGKFYHGKPPENEIAALQREVGDQLVTRVLLLREARRQGVKPDAAEVHKTLQGYEQRYANSEQWKKNRQQLLPGLTARLEDASIVEQIEKRIRNVAKPGVKEVKAYYAANQDKFTEPEQLHVAVILLKVDPSSPKTAWAKADEEALALVKKLNAGANFAELARMHSGDASAQQGGDMGYLHKGMLPDGTQQVLNAMKPGEISNPVQLLEGMAVFRLLDRKVAKLNTFDKVQERAQELLYRDMGDQAWKKFTAELKKKTPVQIDQSRYLPLAEQTSMQIAPKK